MKKKYAASYDSEGDVLTIHSSGDVKESIEVSEDMIIDIDRNDQLVNLEFLDAYKFLNTLNEEISKEALESIKEIEIEVKNYRNYYFISISFVHNSKTFTEKLPAFVNSDFKSPLLASA